MTSIPGWYDDLMMDQPLSNAARVDMCVDTEDHHRALQRAVRAGMTVEELLDAVMDQHGKVGEKLAGLIKKHAPEWSSLQWKSSWDDMK